jgi:hypothetical protein
VFDDKILQQLARIICGDDDNLYYRSGKQLGEFLADAGWQRVDDYDGRPRKAWILEQLRSRAGNTDAIRQVVVRLGDPREYLDDTAVWERVLEELNTAIRFEGVAVVMAGRTPTIREIDDEEEARGSRPMKEGVEQINIPLSAVVADKDLLPLLETRLFEARVCLDNRAALAATFLLGSLLEGLLLDAIQARSRSDVLRTRRGDPTLQQLIEVAYANKWIRKDVHQYADVLRDHRNLVHPGKQLADGHRPDTNTARIAWNVVAAAVNDLGEAFG